MSDMKPFPGVTLEEAVRNIATNLHGTFHRVEPVSAPKPRFIVVHPGDVKVGDAARVFELVDGAYREIEGCCVVVDG